MAGLPQAVRLGKLIRLLSSDKDGEALGAARALARVLAEAGADFHHLAEIVETHWSAPIVVDLFEQHRDPPAKQSTKPWQLEAEQLLKYREVLLGSRELDFLQNMKQSRTAPTAAQEKWMRDIAARRRAA
jgi:hypothetical protein